jgi:hypothetical protein
MPNNLNLAPDNIQNRGTHLKRQEATGILREVLNQCGDYVGMDFVSISDYTGQARVKSTGYEIYIECALCD